ncbi:hypothetical protein BC936DRAFT_147094 [Jimgerdemannia flammicorona]|uniref:F-box domain-containing protein n=1 Tax=Jimgerdemannia flammicorona TaxID=994334 RepID=A0A433D680_9FUNG|nr:hypothetical protein BC936DRAFT_147094 [Jimgerdemannia flammicorona]
MSGVNRSPANMNTVPNEILQTILENLEIDQLFQVMKVSVRWREAVYSALSVRFQDTTVTLWIDQEGHRSCQPKFKFESYNSNTKIIRFVPLKPNGAEVYNQSFGLQKPVLRLITVGTNEHIDYLEKEGNVSVKHTGRKTLLGSDFSSSDKQLHTWSFSYSVDHFYRGDREVSGERVLTPESFECSISFLNPARAHKAKLLWYLKKQTRFLNKNHQRKKINGDATSSDVEDFLHGGVSKDDLYRIKVHKPPGSDDVSQPPRNFWDPHSDYKSVTSRRRDFFTRFPRLA